jgi:hypothetical protein
MSLTPIYLHTTSGATPLTLQTVSGLKNATVTNIQERIRERKKCVGKEGN